MTRPDVNGDVPERLKNKRSIALDLGALLAASPLRWAQWRSTPAFVVRPHPSAPTPILLTGGG